MRKLTSALLLVLIGISAYRVYTLLPVPPCSRPISYTLGTFDNRFGVSRADFLSALQQAEAVWEKPLGKDLFTYASTTGKLKVNLVYDYRQEATKELTSIQGTLDKGNAEYRSDQATYNQVKAKYEEVKASYDAQVAAWQAHNAAYQAEVDRWNAGSRTSKAEFDQLQVDRASLEAEAQALKETEANVNLLVKDTNDLADQLNALGKRLNLGVLQYNQVGQERGETFTGGMYTSDKSGDRIDIFEFQTHEELVRVLAHELGHALGLDHVADPNAIMYAVDEGKGTQATAADIAAAKTLCKIQ